MKNNIIHTIALLLALTACNRPVNTDKLKVVITPLTTGSEASIRALHVVDSNIAWAAGSGGEFLLTANGGRSWKLSRVIGAQEDDLRSIYAWNGIHAIVFGTSNPGTGYMTETAGEDWEVVFRDSSEGIFFNTVSFADELRGMALSDPVDSTSFVIRTRDGGRTWERISGLPLLRESEYHFAASNSCLQYNASGRAWIITGGGGSRVFLTVDHGETWEAIETGIVEGIPSTGIFSVAFTDDRKGIVVGGTYDNPELNNRIAAFTLDGGEKWILSEKMPSAYRSSVFWLEWKGRPVAVAVGKTGIDISGDHGNSWVKVSDEGYYTGRGVSGTNHGFLAGSEGRIARIEIVGR